jgi:zinc protease
MVPTAQPFLYTVSATATDGTSLSAVEHATLEEIERVRREGVTTAELDKAKSQLQARLVFDNDSVTNIAHQIGYFETVASAEVFTSLTARIDAVTLDEVAAAAQIVFASSNRTVGWFDPLPIVAS